MLGQGWLGEEGQERKGEVETCLAFHCWKITIVTCVGLIKQIRCCDTTPVSGKQWNSTVVFLFMRWRWQFIMLLSLNAMKGREQTDLGGFPWTSNMIWLRAWKGTPAPKKRPQMHQEMRSLGSKMWVHICLKYFQIGEIVLFAAKVLGNPMAVNSKMFPRIGHPWFHKCHAEHILQGV